MQLLLQILKIIYNIKEYIMKTEEGKDEFTTINGILIN